MPEMNSKEAITTIEYLLAKEYGGKLFTIEDDSEEIKTILALKYAIKAIKERDDVYKSIDELLERVKEWNRR